MTASNVRRKHSKLRRWRRKAAPFLPWTAGLSVALLVVFGYLVATALSSARHATSASSSLSRVESDLRAGSWPAARSDTRRAVAASHAAKADASGMLFGLAARVPVLGRPFQSLQATADVLDDVARNVVQPVIKGTDVRL